MKFCGIVILALFGCGGYQPSGFRYQAYGSGGSYGYTSRTTGDKTYVVTFHGHPRMPRGMAAQWALHRAAEIAWRQDHEQRFAAEISMEDKDTGDIDCLRRGRRTACNEAHAEVATVTVRLLADHTETRPGDSVYVASEVMGGNYTAAR